MPVMRWRVVCALRDVMLTFWPTSAFIKVDLPTFGRPTIATMPQRKPGGVGAFINVCGYRKVGCIGTRGVGILLVIGSVRRAGALRQWSAPPALTPVSCA